MLLYPVESQKGINKVIGLLFWVIVADIVFCWNHYAFSLFLFFYFKNEAVTFQKVHTKNQ